MAAAPRSLHSGAAAISRSRIYGNELSKWNAHEYSILAPKRHSHERQVTDLIPKMIDGLCRSAVSCNDCFDAELSIARTLVDLAQPRWIGPRYRFSKPRVLVVLTNPGAGNARDGSANMVFRDRLLAYRQGETDLQPVFQHQRSDMPSWGDLFPFYIDGFGLDIDETAFINIAWCASVSRSLPRKNAYPTQMLKRCFERFTSPVVQALARNCSF